MLAAPITFPATLRTIYYPQTGVRVLGELGRSTRNYNFAAEDASGRRYALRLYRKHVARDFIGVPVWTQGFPTPRIIPTRRGDLTVSKVRLWTVLYLGTRVGQGQAWSTQDFQSRPHGF